MADWATSKVSDASILAHNYTGMQNTKIAMTGKSFFYCTSSHLHYIVNSNVVGVSITGVFTF